MIRNRARLFLPWRRKQTLKRRNIPGQKKTVQTKAMRNLVVNILECHLCFWHKKSLWCGLVVCLWLSLCWRGRLGGLGFAAIVALIDSPTGHCFGPLTLWHFTGLHFRPILVQPEDCLLLLFIKFHAHSLCFMFITHKLCYNEATNTRLNGFFFTLQPAVLPKGGQKEYKSK